MAQCINDGKGKFPKLEFDESAQRKDINEKCAKCDDFDVSHYTIFSPHFH